MTDDLLWDNGQF